MKISLPERLRNRFRQRFLDNHGVGIVTTTRNGTLVVDPKDGDVSRHLLNRGEYGWAGVTMLSRLLTPASRVVFVGAHIGALLIPIVRAAGTRQVLAFEATPRVHKMLLMNLALNDLNEVIAENIAVGARPGRRRFSENRIVKADLTRVTRTKSDIEVTVHTLDATIPRTWDAIDLMVMSDQGREADAMRGATRTLAKTRHLYVDFSPEQLAEQGSTAEEFVELAASHFKSAYVLGEKKPRFLAQMEFPSYLLDLAARRGRIVNLLLSRDAKPSAQFEAAA
jgi:FkbM family methyltransferase